MIKHLSSYRLHLLTGLLSAITFLPSCNSDVDPGPQEGSEYIPLEIGNYWIYDVEKYEFFGNYFFSGDTLYPSDEYSDTSIFQLKEVISQEHTDLEGEPFFELKRYVRPDETSSWTLDSLWSCKIDGNRYIRTENNVPYIRLQFPVIVGKEWDMNALNSVDTDSIGCDFSIYDSKTSYQYKNVDFSDVLKVIHCHDSTALSNFTEIEYYVSGVGLVYRNYNHYDFCYGNDDEACVGQEIIDNGIKYTWNLVEYGKQ